MFLRISITTLSLIALLLASCGDDGSPTDSGPPNPQPTATTPEEFLTLLDSAVTTMNFPLYRALFDSSYVFEPCTYFEWPGDTAAAWGFAEEMDAVERLFSGTQSYHAFVIREIAITAPPETVFVDSVAEEKLPVGGSQYRIRFRIEGTVVLDSEDPLEPTILFFSSRQEITLRPERFRPDHLVAVLETEEELWGIGSQSPPNYTWGFVKSMFRDGAETPEEFLGRIVESFPRDRSLLHSSFEFYSCADDTARGITPVFSYEEIQEALRNIWYHRDNPNGWRTTSIQLSLDPKTIIENEDHHVDKMPEETWWDIQVETRLNVTFLAPSGEEEDVTIVADQLWILRSNQSDGGLRLFRQYDFGTTPDASAMTWGYLFAMFLPEDPDAVVMRFVRSYDDGDLERYANCLDDSFRFEMEASNPNDPAPGWGVTDETQVADRIFNGWANPIGQAVLNRNLSTNILRAINRNFTEYPDWNSREGWYEVNVDVEVTFSVDEGDGLSPVEYQNTAEHRFIVRPNGEVPIRFLVYRHLDPEPLDYGPNWDKGGVKDFDYLELDANSILGDGPDHRQYDMGDTIAVDCWMMGSATVRTWGVTVCPLTPALRFIDAVYDLPDDWSGSSPTPYLGCTTLTGNRHSDGIPITLPHKAGTYRFLVVEDDVYSGLDIDPSNSAWLGEDQATSGNFLDAGGFKVRVGRPTTKPSSWGSTKMLFR